MGRSELFSYLSAFVTIVLAVAITNIVQSASLLIRARRRVRWDARPLFFAAIIFVMVVSEFFSVWQTLAVSEISLPRLLWMLAVPTVFALLAYLTLPDQVPDTGLDLAEFYHDERHAWAVLVGLATILDLVRILLPMIEEERPVTPFLGSAALELTPFFAGLGLIFVARSRLWSWVGLGLLLPGVLGAIISWTISVAGR